MQESRSLAISKPFMIFPLRQMHFSRCFAVVAFLGAGSVFGDGGPPVTEISEADLVRQYRGRCNYVIDQTVANTDPNDLSRGSSFTIAANLFRGENLDWARERLRLSNDSPTGAMFWMHPMALLMHAGREELNEDDWAFIRELMNLFSLSRRHGKPLGDVLCEPVFGCGDVSRRRPRSLVQWKIL